jgi:methanogenic corrinoid protein MtbC1
MTASNESPFISIGQVVQELSHDFPDITHSSLRFLERERLIEPTRTPGGHRLFSPADVRRVRQIKEWQQDRLSLDDIRARLDAADRLPPPDELARQVLDLAINGDLHQARRLVLEADELGMPLVKIFDTVLKPVLYRLGDLWESGEIPVGQEKEVSALVRDLVAELSIRHASATENGAAVVAACVQGEFHELGLRMISGLLEAGGYVVHYLGPSVAPEFLAERVRRRSPAAVLLTATREEQFSGVELAVRVLRDELPPDELPPIVVGGQIVNTLRDRIESLGVTASQSDSIEETVRALKRQIAKPLH